MTLDKLFATMAQIVPRLEKWRRLGKMHVVKSDSLASAVCSLNTSKRSLDGPRTAPAGDSLTALDSRQEAQTSRDETAGSTPGSDGRCDLPSANYKRMSGCVAWHIAPYGAGQR